MNKQAEKYLSLPVSFFQYFFSTIFHQFFSNSYYSYKLIVVIKILSADFTVFNFSNIRYFLYVYLVQEIALEKRKSLKNASKRYNFPQQKGKLNLCINLKSIISFIKAEYIVRKRKTYVKYF